MELLGRDAQVHALNVRADVAGGDAGELQAAALDPGEELLDGVEVVLAGVGVGDLGLEELLPGELSGAAGCLDDGRRIAGGDRLPAGRELTPIRTPNRRRSRSSNRSFSMPPLPGNLMIDNALCLSLNRPRQGGIIKVKEQVGHRLVTTTQIHDRRRCPTACKETRSVVSLPYYLGTKETHCMSGFPA